MIMIYYGKVCGGLEKTRVNARTKESWESKTGIVVRYVECGGVRARILIILTMADSPYHVLLTSVLAALLSIKYFLSV